ncbi:MAG: GAP family protein [Actinomycetota bacterium]|nr:GAP family protein [Actinomycetota bacterium]MDP2287007.1 GAP family protein [Actinomycetota bacterium]
MSSALSTWVQLLPLALAVCINPLPIIAVVLVLLTPRGRANGASMLLGWFLGLLVLAGIAIALGNHTTLYGSEGDTPLARWLQGILGIGLLVLAARQWRGRKSKAEPGWMTSLADISVFRSFGFGALLSAGNPKNILLTLSAMALLVEVGLSTSDEIIVLLGFVLVASIGVAVPPLLVLSRGASSQPMLEHWRNWLSQYSGVLMAVVLGIIGAILLIRSLT